MGNRLPHCSVDNISYGVWLMEWRPVNWEELKPHVWIPPDCKDPDLYNELFNAGVESGADVMYVTWNKHIKELITGA